MANDGNIKERIISCSSSECAEEDRKEENVIEDTQS
jgi:hypothetical protein